MKAGWRRVKPCDVGIDAHRSTESQSVALRHPPRENLDLLALLFDHPLVLVVGANPDPDEVRAVLHGDGAVIDPNPWGP